MLILLKKGWFRASRAVRRSDGSNLSRPCNKSVRKVFDLSTCWETRSCSANEMEIQQSWKWNRSMQFSSQGRVRNNDMERERERWHEQPPYLQSIKFLYSPDALSWHSSSWPIQPPLPEIFLCTTTEKYKEIGNTSNTMQHRISFTHFCMNVKFFTHQYTINSETPWSSLHTIFSTYYNN